MLPAPLVGAYQQYKADTDAVAAWLASTAAAHGYSLDRPQNSDATESKPAVTGRLKGKARKDAKRAAEGQIKALRTYRIAIKDFVILSEHIASKSVSVPSSFASTLNRLIRVRQSFGQRLEKHGSVLDESSNDNHSFFVSILEAVRETLRPWFQMSIQTSDSTEPTDHLEETTNRFARLFVYEPSDQFLNAPDIERPKPATGDTAVYQAEHLTTAGEAQMAFLLVMDDLNAIRHRVNWIWENYKIKVFDLISAAIATNTAVELARNIVDEVIPLIEATCGVETCIIDILKVRLQQASEPYTQSDDENDTYPYVHHEHYRLSVDTYYSAYMLVRMFRDNTPENEMVTFAEELPYDPDSDRAVKTGHQKHVEDIELLSHFLREVRNMEIAKVPHQACDEVIHGMQEMDRTGEIPFYLVFAVQIFLDIRHSLGSDVHRAFNTLEVNLNRMRVDLASHLELHGRSSYIPKGCTIPTTDFISNIILSVDNFLDDPLFRIKTKAHLYHGWEVPNANQRNHLSKMSPVLSGLVLFSFTFAYQTCGLLVEQQWNTIVAATHLHNAVCSEKLVSTKWRDMMMMRALFEDSNFFVGSPPTNPNQYHRRLQLQIGYSAATFSTNSRESSKFVAARQTRKIEIADILPVSSLFTHLMLHTPGQSTWTAEVIDQVNRLSRYQETGEIPTGLAFTSSEDLRKFMEINQTLLDIKTRRRNNSTGGTQLIPDQVILKLTHALNNEKLGMGFPWLKMHHCCWSFLYAIKLKVDKRWFHEGCGIPLYPSLIPSWTFACAADGDMSLMNVAAAVAREYYRDSGSQIFRELTERGLSISVVVKDEHERKEYEEMFPSGFCPPGVPGHFWYLPKDL